MSTDERGHHILDLFHVPTRLCALAWGGGGGMLPRSLCKHCTPHKSFGRDYKQRSRVQRSRSHVKNPSAHVTVYLIMETLELADPFRLVFVPGVECGFLRVYNVTWELIEGMYLTVVLIDTYLVANAAVVKHVVLIVVNAVYKSPLLWWKHPACNVQSQLAFHRGKWLELLMGQYSYKSHIHTKILQPDNK